MARSLAAASSQYLEITSAVVSGPPFSVAYWFNVTNTTGAHNGFSLYKTTEIGYYVVGPRGDIGGDPVQATTDNGTTPAGTASTSTGYSANVWQHACGVFAANDSRSAYLNGGSKGTDATSRTFTPERTACGSLFFNGSRSANYFNGKIAHVGVWDVALTDGEVASLAAGYSPLLVRPGSLVAYWPLGGFHGNYDRDLLGAYNMIAYNSPTFADQPRIIYPRIVNLPQRAAAVGGATPWLYARRRSQIIGSGGVH